jgi:membrane-bound serine protease (ClpP class)
MIRKILCAGIVLASPLLAAPPRVDPVYVLTVAGVIDPVIKNYVLDGLDRARDAGAQAVLIRLDTPGGLLDATRDLIQGVLNAPLPVIVYVAPSGARAASAGVFITLAADVAAMAPLTHLGAAHPVQLGGGSPIGGKEPKDGKEEKSKDANASAMEEKMVSDAAAYARALASAKNRNVDWAERAVRESVSLTAEEALKNKVIDLIAADEAALFAALKTREIKKNGATWTLDLALAPRVDFAMNLVRRWLHTLAHPNLAYILLVLGFYALVYEFSTPGIGLGAIAGVICLTLAFFSLQVLPLNFAGLTLLIAGLIMMALDVIVASHGLLIFGGLLSFAIGSLMLFDRGPSGARVSLELIGGTLLVSGGFFGLVLKKIFEIRKARPVSGAESLVGQIAETRDNGQVFLNGALWTAEGIDGLAPGTPVTVVAVLGTRVKVQKRTEGA